MSKRHLILVSGKRIFSSYTIFAVMSSKTLSKEKLRWITLVFFFLSGIITATWAARIPDVQHKLGVNDAEWGFILFAMPVGLVTGLPISSWLVAKYTARRIMVATSIVFAALLFLLPVANNKWYLAAMLFLFGLLRNATNFSINTYSIEVQKLYDRPIIATFHGVWSLACLLAAGFGTIMLAMGVIPLWHFLIVTIVAITLCLLYKNGGYDKQTKTNERRPLLVKPTRYLFLLGLITFCSMIGEVTMFDWGINYFRSVLKVEDKWSTAGYTAYTIAMVAGRLTGDRLIAGYGFIKMLILSGALMAIGFFMAILFPYFFSACIGFLLVGLGNSILVPMVYSLAGQSKEMTPGYAIASVTIIGYVGFLAGPVLVGLISESAGMQWAFGLMGVLSLFIIWITFVLKKPRYDVS